MIRLSWRSKDLEVQRFADQTFCKSSVFANQTLFECQNVSKVDAGENTAPPSGTCHARKSTCVKRGDIAVRYLRAAHAYMLISMPTGTSTIFGAFQAIWLSFLEPDDFRPVQQGNAQGKVRQLNLFLSISRRASLLHREGRCWIGGEMLQNRRLSTASASSGWQLMAEGRCGSAPSARDKELVKSAYLPFLHFRPHWIASCRDIFSTPGSAMS
jgi:hypothetical protein